VELSLPCDLFHVSKYEHDILQQVKTSYSSDSVLKFYSSTHTHIQKDFCSEAKCNLFSISSVVHDVQKMKYFSTAMAMEQMRGGNAMGYKVDCYSVVAS
jgi:hypothetical protein